MTVGAAEGVGSDTEQTMPQPPVIKVEKVKKKKQKRIRLLRQDVFKPELVPDDKKVVCLARKTSLASRKVLEKISTKK